MGKCMKEMLDTGLAGVEDFFMDLLVTILLKVVDGLMFLHSKNMVHRDIKPANIIVKQDQPIIIDFGLFYHLSLTPPVYAAGSRVYISPEVYKRVSIAVSEGKKSKKSQTQEEVAKTLISSDLYALGVSVYRLINGKYPTEIITSMRY